MTQAQWLAEAIFLRKQEKDQLELTRQVFKEGVKALREVLVSVLGSNIGAGRKKNEDGTSQYLPFVLYVTKPEILDEMIKRDEAGVEAENKTLDDLNDFLMGMDDGDLEPLFDDTEMLRREQAAIDRASLEKLGVDLQEGDEGLGLSFRREDFDSFKPDAGPVFDPRRSSIGIPVELDEVLCDGDPLRDFLEEEGDTIITVPAKVK